MKFLLHVHVSMEIIGLWFSIQVILFRKFAGQGKPAPTLVPSPS
jgi:hypothetical protein